MVIEKKKSTVKRKLRNKFLKEDCEIIRLIETSIANKEASEEFEGPKITVVDWDSMGRVVIQTRGRAFQALC